MQIIKNVFAPKSKMDLYTVFKRLEVFIKIVECNNLSLAAKKLNLTPSAVSRTLSKLEEQVGVILIKRTTRNIRLTEAGEYLLNQAIKLLSALDETLTNTSGFYNYPQGQLKITCSIAFGTLILMDLYNEYQQTNQEVTLSVDLNDHLVNLNEENFDIALRISDEVPQNFVCHKICDIHWVYCATQEYWNKKGIPKCVEDLENHDCLVNPSVDHAWRKQEPNGNFVPLNIKNVIQANSSLALLAAALNHQGIVCLPTYIISQHVYTKKLIPVLTPCYNEENAYHLYAINIQSKFNNPKIKSFIHFLTKKFEHGVFWDEWMKEYPLGF
ncbi:LysR family transcriptional regulator [Orbaceae bacterium ac157xtp]